MKHTHSSTGGQGVRTRVLEAAAHGAENIKAAVTPKTTVEEEKELHDIDVEDLPEHEDGRSRLWLRGQFNQNYTKISFYVVSTFLICLILFKVANNITEILAVLGMGIHYLWMALRPLLAGFVIAYLLYPVVTFLQGRLNKVPLLRSRKKSNRGLAILLTALITILAVILILSIVISALSREMKMISFDDIPDFLDGLSASLQDLYQVLQEWMERMNLSSKVLSDFAENISSWVGNYASSLASSLNASVSNITSFFTNAIFAIIFAVYFLSDAEGLRRYWDRALKAFASREFYGGVHTVLSDANRVFSGYVRGQLLDCLLVAAEVSIVLSLLNVRFAVIIGLLTGIGNLIPYVGSLMAYLCTSIVCLLDMDLRKLILCLVVLFLVMTLDGNLVQPRLLSSTIEIHPMLVIVSLLIGGSIGGVFGLLLAVPTGALLKVWFDRFVERMITRRTA